MIIPPIFSLLMSPQYGAIYVGASAGGGSFATYMPSATAPKVGVSSGAFDFGTANADRMAVVMVTSRFGYPTAVSVAGVDLGAAIVGSAGDDEAFIFAGLIGNTGGSGTLTVSVTYSGGVNNQIIACGYFAKGASATPTDSKRATPVTATSITFPALTVPSGGFAVGWIVIGGSTGHYTWSDGASLSEDFYADTGANDTASATHGTNAGSKTYSATASFSGPLKGGIVSWGP
jgi:hypothetical protein